MSIPLPRDPRHQRIADLVLDGMNRCDAYRTVFPRASKANSRSLSSRVLKRPDVVAYMAAIRSAAARDTHLTLAEKRQFCADVVRARITQLPDDSPLWQEWREEETETSHRLLKKLPSKIDALKVDNDLDADSPTHNALDQLATALATLSGKR